MNLVATQSDEVAQPFKMEHFDISDIPMRFLEPDMNQCEFDLGGWLLLARCGGVNIYIADIQSLVDVSIYSPQVYWETQNKDKFKLVTQPVNQFTNITSQTVYFDYTEELKRQTFLFYMSDLQRIGRNQDNFDMDTLNLNEAVIKNNFGVITGEIGDFFVKSGAWEKNPKELIVN